MATYTVLADARENEFQNVQELAAVGGDVRAVVSEYDGDVHDVYAVLGRYDYQITYEAADVEAAMKIAMAIEQLGLDTNTIQLVDVERIGEFVDDV